MEEIEKGKLVISAFERLVVRIVAIDWCAGTHIISIFRTGIGPEYCRGHLQCCRLLQRSFINISQALSTSSSLFNERQLRLRKALLPLPYHLT